MKQHALSVFRIYHVGLVCEKKLLRIGVLKSDFNDILFAKIITYSFQRVVFVIRSAYESVCNVNVMLDFFKHIKEILLLWLLTKPTVYM